MDALRQIRRDLESIEEESSAESERLYACLVQNDLRRKKQISKLQNRLDELIENSRIFMVIPDKNASQEISASGDSSMLPIDQDATSKRKSKTLPTPRHFPQEQWSETSVGTLSPLDEDSSVAASFWTTDNSLQSSHSDTTGRLYIKNSQRPNSLPGKALKKEDDSSKNNSAITWKQYGHTLEHFWAKCDKMIEADGVSGLEVSKSDESESSKVIAAQIKPRSRSNKQWSIAKRDDAAKMKLFQQDESMSVGSKAKKTPGSSMMQPQSLPTSAGTVPKKKPAVCSESTHASKTTYSLLICPEDLADRKKLSSTPNVSYSASVNFKKKDETVIVLSDDEDEDEAELGFTGRVTRVGSIDSIFDPGVIKSSSFQEPTSVSTSGDLPIYTRDEFVALEGGSMREWVLVGFPENDKIYLMIHQLHYDSLVLLRDKICAKLREQAEKTKKKMAKDPDYPGRQRWCSLRQFLIKLVEVVVGRSVAAKRTWGRESIVKGRTPFFPNEWFSISGLLFDLDILGELKSVENDFEEIYNSPNQEIAEHRFANYLVQHKFKGIDEPSRVYLVLVG